MHISKCNGTTQHGPYVGLEPRPRCIYGLAWPFKPNTDHNGLWRIV